MSKDEYLITDTPLKALTVFAMPMILGSFFQQVYNMADSIIVGQFVGSSALAAVGACAALTNVFICIALGAGVGAVDHQADTAQLLVHLVLQVKDLQLQMAAGSGRGELLLHIAGGSARSGDGFFAQAAKLFQ